MKSKIKPLVAMAAVALLVGAGINLGAGLEAWRMQADAAGCPSLRVVFARGSGGERWNDRNYLAYKAGIEAKLQTVALDYEFIDLDYPAVGIGIENLGVTAGAWFGAGEAYEFGDSVNTGVENLLSLVKSCPNTQYVIGGYSQGAMVVSKSLKRLKPNQIIYAATFGDPKLYLPEGGGLNPPACSGAGLSDYRMYVPDCHAYKGLLGGYVPYEPTGFLGKVGTWCNKRDFFCSSYRVPSDHTAYVADNLYEDASKVIFNKITSTFGLENHVSSPHDTAILLDLSAPMAAMAEQYRDRVAQITNETINAGGRVAVYYYDGAGNAFSPKRVCDFESCTMADLKPWLDDLRDRYSGASQGSLMSAAFNAMSDLTWRKGSTKSLVVLTATNYGSPNQQGVTLDKVSKLSKQIDPVNIYVATDASMVDGDTLASYAALAAATDGQVATNAAEFETMLQGIMTRFDSLPRVEDWWDEEMGARPETPQIDVLDAEWASDTEAEIRFQTDGTEVLVALNDKILGVMGANERTVTITGLDQNAESTVTLVPMNTEVRGEPVEITLATPVPKAPDTGRR